MNDKELIVALRRNMVETGSLICLGCGHEHMCSTHGCVIMRDAADLIEQLTAPQPSEPPTNADRIRRLRDEELARFLAKVETRRSAAGGGAQWCGMAHAPDWLRRSAKEEKCTKI